MWFFFWVNVENYVGPTCLINHGPVLSDCKGTLGGLRLDMGLDGQSGHHLVKARLVTNTVDHFFSLGEGNLFCKNSTKVHREGKKKQHSAITHAHVSIIDALVEPGKPKWT